MAIIKLLLYVLLLISCACSDEIEIQCPKLCQCERNVETGLRVKCENIKDIKEILFGENSSEIAHL